MADFPGAAYDNWLLRGSGINSTEREVTLDEPCQTEGCGSTEGMLHVDDYGQGSIECENGHEQPTPEPDDEPDHWDEYDPEDDR